MRLELALGLAALVTAAYPASATLGLTVSGFGFGDAIASTGESCPDVPFVVNLLFLPGDKGILKFSWADLGCFNSGGYTALGILAYQTTVPPTAEWRFVCAGNEGRGLDCGAVAAGPYGGLGSLVWLKMQSGIERFDGIFTAV